MAEGEVSLWIRVRDGFTAGFKSAVNATKTFAGQAADVARGASTTIGGELKSIWGRLSGELSQVLSDIPGLRKLSQGIKGSIGALFSGAAIIGNQIGNVIEGVANKYAEITRKINDQSIKFAAEQDQIQSKMRTGKTAESDEALARDIISKIKEVKRELADAEFEFENVGMGGRAFGRATGTRGAEEGRIQALREQIALLERQKELARERGQDRAAAEKSEEAQAAAIKRTEESAKAIAAATKERAGLIEAIAKAQGDITAAQRTETDEQRRARLVRERDAAGRAIAGGADLQRMGLDIDVAAMREAVETFRASSVEIAEMDKKAAEDKAQSERKAAEDRAKQSADLAKKEEAARLDSLRKQGDALLTEAKRRGAAIANAADAAADRANFRNMPETFKEQLDAFVSRREAAKQAAEENKNLLEREARVREKLARGIGLSKKDEQLMKDLAGLRAAQKADAEAARRRKQVDDAIINTEKKIDQVLKASGGPV